MVQIPENFNGSKFAAKYSFSTDPMEQGEQFWLDEQGLLICPSLPDLTEADIADCVDDPIQLDRVASRKRDAEGLAASVPGYATWSPEEALAWFDANLSDAIIDSFSIPANVKNFMKAQNAALKGLGRMVIAYRDDRWPAMPEG